MLRSLGEGRIVTIVIDQNVRTGSRVFVPFLGRLAATTPMLALLALRTGAPVVPVFALPRRGARYHVVYLPEVTVEQTGDRERDVLELTASCTAIIEQWVRRQPGCWLWMHDRWKSRPRPGEPRTSGAEALAG
jgi:KDO2-lipid IV(A) lauroyltransferase